ncbi:hypothetical protein L6452_40932 [Arctium lappa]|uniref:Uncharacterized protein n=1 Tax=Arctium lappa TaxID=4217 RepID=A0ACB8XNI7_ARCLA|nr:hypothetical protein L6452_40932 [Arctium lappa]
MRSDVGSKALQPPLKSGLHEKQPWQYESCKKSSNSKPKLDMAKQHVMPTLNPYSQNYEPKIWKPVNLELGLNTYQNGQDTLVSEDKNQAQQLTDYIKRRAYLLDPVDYYQWDYGTIVGNKDIKTTWSIDSKLHEERLRQQRSRY